MEIKLKGVEAVLKKFDHNKVIKAASMSLNRAVRSGKTEMSNQVRKGEMPFNLLKRYVDDKLLFRASIKTNLRASITITGEPIILTRFQAKETSGGVKATVIKGRRTFIKGAFIARGRGGTLMVFRRIRGTKSPETGREKLHGFKVNTLASMVNKPRVMNRVVRKIETQWNKEFGHQVSRIAKGEV